jgi:superfamily II DNA or RNA helicase
MDQWKTQMMKFLSLNAKEIGIIGGSKKKGKGLIDIATLQTLARTDSKQSSICNAVPSAIQ